MFNENSNDSYVFTRLAYCDKHNIKPSYEMRIIPVPFSTNHAKMLQHLKMLIDEGLIAISPKFDKLIIALRTAVATEYKLDKSGKTTQPFLHLNQIMKEEEKEEEETTTNGIF
jgi:hypothetical protein